MDPSAYTTIGTAEPALIALIVAVATGGPSLIVSVYKWRKTAPSERDDLVTRAAQQAVETMETAIKAAARERTELVTRVARLEKRVEQLEAGWPKGHPLPTAR